MLLRFVHEALAVVGLPDQLIRSWRSSSVSDEWFVPSISRMMPAIFVGEYRRDRVEGESRA